MTRLQVGDKVKCPADRGNMAYTGQVLSVGTEVYKTMYEQPYVWVEVLDINRRSKSLWPSNRLNK